MALTPGSAAPKATGSHNPPAAAPRWVGPRGGSPCASSTAPIGHSSHISSGQWEMRSWCSWQGPCWETPPPQGMPGHAGHFWEQYGGREGTFARLAHPCTPTGGRGAEASVPSLGWGQRPELPPLPPRPGVSRDVPADGCFWGWPGATGHGMRAACLPEPRCTAGLDSGAGWEMRFGLKFGVPRPWGAPWHYVVCFRVNPLLACSSLRPPICAVEGKLVCICRGLFLRGSGSAPSSAAVTRWAGTSAVEGRTPFSASNRPPCFSPGSSSLAGACRETGAWPLGSGTC